MEKKFIKLMESNITRSLRGGFLVGDYIELISDYKSHQAYKDLHDNVKKDLDDLVNSKLHLRVIGINDNLPQRYGGNPEMMNGQVILSLAQDQGGGRRYNNVLVPSCLCVTKSFYPNYAPFPDQFNYDNKEILKPKEVEEVQSGINGVTYSLPATDNPLPVKKNSKSTKKGKSKSKNKKKKIQKESYTAEYLSGMEYFR